MSSTPTSNAWINAPWWRPHQAAVTIWFWIALWVFYFAAFILLFQVVDRAAMAANLLPILVYTLKYGRRGGLIVLFLLIPANLLGYYLLGGSAELESLTNKFWVAQAGLPLLIYLLGWNIELRLQVQQELASTKHLQQQFLFERNRAITANKAKDDLLATVSHDLRTPISGIIQSAQLLQHVLPNDTRAQVSSNIQTSAHQLLYVINELLDLYRQDAQAAVETPETFDLGAQIADIAQLMQPLFQARNLMLDTVLDAEIPARVTGHPKLLRQTLFNLLGNSLKYTQQGGVTIKLALQDNAKNVTISIADTGQGIPEERIPAILDSSHRHARVMLGDTESGYGLGIRNCLKMVAAMQGELTLQSVLGEGTCFTLTLPLISPSPELMHELQAETRPIAIPMISTASETESGRRVLLVEDDETYIVSLTAMLELLGCQISIARDVAQALRVGRQTFDLVLVDMQLPDGHGEDVIKALRDTERQSAPRPWIVLLTANVLMVDPEQWLSLDRTMVLTKPISLHELQQLFDLSGVAEAEQAVVPGEQTLDTDFLQSEQKLLGRPALHQVLATFVAEAPGYLKGCLIAFGKQDYPLCNSYAHKLCGAARSVGLPLLSRQASDVEQHCLQENRISLYFCLLQLQQGVQQAELTLQNIIAQDHSL